MVQRRLMVIVTLIISLSIGIAWAVCRPRTHGPDLRTFSAMTFNVGDVGRRAFPVADTAACIQAGERPDLLFLQEMPVGKSGRELQAALSYPYRSMATTGQGKLARLMVLSVFPIAETREIVLPSRSKGAGALCAVVDVGGEMIEACSVHLDEIEPKPRNTNGDVVLTAMEIFRFLRMEFFRDTVRTQSVRALTDAIMKDTDMPVIFGGDFNTVPGSRTIRHMSGLFRDALWPTPAYFTGTYHKIAFPINPRIDYLFVSNQLVARDSRVVRRSAGDHYPVKAIMELKIRKTDGFPGIRTFGGAGQ
ncbi:MAG: endonuclease/exonuclease/phosphatase family protein [Desulfobacterales bacterium]|nr:endonuclease/exonuclease/phosphatase family protein [Desulfobacterales bacterium]